MSDQWLLSSCEKLTIQLSLFLVHSTLWGVSFLQLLTLQNVALSNSYHSVGCMVIISQSDFHALRLYLLS